MSTEKELQARSESKCELCSATDSLGAEGWARDLLDMLYLEDQTLTRPGLALSTRQFEQLIQFMDLGRCRSRKA